MATRCFCCKRHGIFGNGFGAIQNRFSTFLFILGGHWYFLKMMLKQKKLDEALMAGAASRRVNIDKLMTSTIHTLINYNIEFTPATTSRNALHDGNLKYIILKPENEPTKKQHLANNIQSKKNIAKFMVHKFQHKHHNNKVKQNINNRKSIGKRKLKTIKKNRQKKQQQINKS
ncbi:2,3-bisphosphoglycerate-dependent phosphoglycerate mutase [Dirofilaria immitis]